MANLANDVVGGMPVGGAPVPNTTAAPKELFDFNTKKQVLSSLGVQLSAGAQPGDGSIRAALLANPSLINPFETAGRRFDPNFNLDGLRATIAPGIPITDVMANNVQNPTLPKGAEFTPTLQTVQGNELQQFTPTAAAPVIQAPQAISAVPVATAAPVVAAAVNPTDITNQINPNAGQVKATMTSAVPQMQAAQGQVSDLATVQGQLKKLYADTEDGQVPTWAKGAMTKASEIMAARGLGASSIAGAAITEAIQQSAIQIAAPDAATYFQMDMANLNNRQQTNLQNTQMAQQNMLTDTSISNATAQINASSASQTQQFVAQLVTQIKSQNASLTTSVDQFNASEANKASAMNAQNDVATKQFNAQMETAVDQFNSNLISSRDQFNSTMQYAIDQSNVNWRRSVNTANTASVNAAMQANVQNLFNLSAVAQNNIWQQFRDEASWTFTASQDQANQAFLSSQASTNRAFNGRNDNIQTAIAIGSMAAQFMNH
jgi:hypothetical protein